MFCHPVLPDNLIVFINFFNEDKLELRRDDGEVPTHLLSANDDERRYLLLELYDYYLFYYLISPTIKPYFCNDNGL